MITIMRDNKNNKKQQNNSNSNAYTGKFRSLGL